MADNDRGSFTPRVACNCEQCAEKHGDQALSDDERELSCALDKIRVLVAENKRLSDENATLRNRIVREARA